MIWSSIRLVSLVLIEKKEGGKGKKKTFFLGVCFSLVLIFEKILEEA